MNDHLKEFEKTNPIIKTDNESGALQINAEEYILSIIAKKKEAVELEDKLKDYLKGEMESKGIKKITSDKISINFTEAQENIESFDKKKLREEHPDIYDECCNFNGKRSSYITIKLR